MGNMTPMTYVNNILCETNFVMELLKPRSHQALRRLKDREASYDVLVGLVHVQKPGYDSRDCKVSQDQHTTS